MKYLLQIYPNGATEAFERLPADEQAGDPRRVRRDRAVAGGHRRRAAAAGRDRDDRAHSERRDAAHGWPVRRREGAPGRLLPGRGGRSRCGARDRRADPGRANGRRDRGAAVGREVALLEPLEPGPRPSPYRLPATSTSPRRPTRARGRRERRPRDGTPRSSPTPLCSDTIAARSCPLPPLPFVAMTTPLKNGSSHWGANPDERRGSCVCSLPGGAVQSGVVSSPS